MVQEWEADFISNHTQGHSIRVVIFVIHFFLEIVLSSVTVLQPIHVSFQPSGKKKTRSLVTMLF